MSGNDLTEGRDPAKLLRYLLTINDNTTPNYNNNPPSNNANESESKENIPITRLADMGEEEKQKWTQIILGQTPDILNNRASLQQAIERLKQIKGNIKKPSLINNTNKDKDENKDNDDDNNNKDPNEEIKCCISIIHNLLDKNEAVLAKLNGIPLLFELMQSSLDIDNEIFLDCCTILHDATKIIQ